MELFTIVANVFGIVSAIFAFSAWWQARRLRQEVAREQARQNQTVRVRVQYGADYLELPVELRRGELTRAELLGRLGMIPKKEKVERFFLTYLNTPAFLRELNRIRESNGDAMLIIPTNQEEFAQFDVKK